MSSRRKGTITVTALDGTEYLAEIREKKCPCSPGLFAVPVSKPLAFVRGLAVPIAVGEIQARGWTARVNYDG